MNPSGSIGVKSGQSSESVGVCLFSVIKVFVFAVMDACMYQFSSMAFILRHVHALVLLFCCCCCPFVNPTQPPSLKCIQTKEGYTRTPCHNHFCLVVGTHITSLRSDDLVVTKLPCQTACRCEWWWRLVFPSTGGDWWATCHEESCVQYSRLWCGIGGLPLLRPPFTYGVGVLLVQ